VAKVIRSAQANAENNFNLVRDDLVIKDIRVEPGPMLKRGQPRAMGRLFSVFKRTSHITAVVEDRPGVVRRRTAALPRAPQPTAARPVPTPAAAAAARAAAEPATTESDERETTRQRGQARVTKPEQAEASKTGEKGKKTESKTSGTSKPEAKKTGKTSEEKPVRGRAEGKKKDSQEKGK
jgi:hypothetical protein